MLISVILACIVLYFIIIIFNRQSVDRWAGIQAASATEAASAAAHERKLLKIKELPDTFVEVADVVDKTLHASQHTSGYVVGNSLWIVHSSRFPDFTVRITLDVTHILTRDGKVVIIIQDPGAVARVSAALREVDMSKYTDPAIWSSVGTVVDYEAFSADVYPRDAVIIAIYGYTIPLTVEQKATA